MKKILYKAGKLERGTAFEIYTDRTLVIKTKITNPGIHIAARIHEWLNVTKSKNNNLINVDIIVNEGTNNEEILRNQKVSLKKEHNGLYIKFLKTDEDQKRISKMLKSKITCIIKKFEPTQLFYQNKELFKDSVSKIDYPKLILERRFGIKNTDSLFRIYQANSEQLLIESYGYISETGRLWLSQELGRFIKDWWNLNNCFVVGAVNNGEKTVLKLLQRKKKENLKMK